MAVTCLFVILCDNRLLNLAELAIKTVCCPADVLITSAVVYHFRLVHREMLQSSAEILDDQIGWEDSFEKPNCLFISSCFADF